MQDESPPNKESAGIKKKWLRILIIVAIGIPVLLELSTLFNLVKVQFWGKEEPENGRVQTENGVREVTAGDTLSIDREFMLIFQEMRIGVSPGRWEYKLELETTGETDEPFRIFIDSLELNSGVTISGKVASEEWVTETEDKWGNIEMGQAWEIPDGDIPRTLFMRLEKRVAADSVARIRKRVPLGPIPVRYQSDIDSSN